MIVSISATVSPAFYVNFKESQGESHPEATMLANETEITEHRLRSICARHRAKTALSMSYRSVSLSCQINLPRRNRVVSRRSRFISDAIRQLQQMPETGARRPDLQLVEDLTQGN